MIIMINYHKYIWHLYDIDIYDTYEMDPSVFWKLLER